MSYISKFEYKKNDDNELFSAIYPLNEVLNQNSLIREHLGGSSQEGSPGSRFDGLGVPVGLYLSRKQMGEIQHMKKNPEIQKECNVIDEETFNKLMDRIVKKAKKRTSLNNRGNKKGSKKLRK
jgi:hypothetical protein